jgi:hypothetical protein
MFRWADTKALEEAAKPPPKPLDPRIRMLQWFVYDHLPAGGRPVAAQFNSFANWMLQTIPSGPEATEAMRKLLECRDCAVRAALEPLPKPE